MIVCPKCEDIEMDWEADNNEQLNLSTYICPLCNLNVNINWKNNDKREKATRKE